MHNCMKEQSTRCNTHSDTLYLTLAAITKITSSEPYAAEKNAYPRVLHTTIGSESVKTQFSKIYFFANVFSDGYEFPYLPCTVYEMHVYGMNAYEMHAYEMHAYEMHACEVHAHKVYIYGVYTQ
jgi:hypothetical protein